MESMAFWTFRASIPAIQLRDFLADGGHDQEMEIDNR
jgi:hypothetical protein